VNSAQDQTAAGSGGRESEAPWDAVMRWGGWALFAGAVVLVVFVA
jgi:hypothetical protein